MKQTHYDVLGVKRDVGERELRAAYRRLVLKHHPDRSNAPDATATFIRITEAYEVLSDPDRRVSYDRLIGAGQSKPRPAADVPTHQKPRTQTKPKPDLDLISELSHLTGLLGKARFAEAERIAERLTRTHPREAVPYAVMGDIASFRGDLKKAATMYAYAAQMAPESPVYERKHEQALGAWSRRPVEATANAKTVSGAMLVGGSVVAVSSTYLVLGQETPVLPQIELISSWTLGLIVMLFLSGIAVGASLTLAGLVDRFGTTHGSAVVRVPPSVVLGLIAVVNYWIASAFYLVVGASQNAFNASTSRVVAAVGIVTLFLALSSSFSGSLRATETLWWGGNVVYIGALVGWFVADSFRGHGD